MAKSLSKVIYKPDSQSTDEYVVVVDTEEVRLLVVKWYGSSSIIFLVQEMARWW